jgi:protein-S-isoprenylcysteine O-methyltransferase Ste14
VVLGVLAVVVGLAGQQALRRAGTPILPGRTTTALVVRGPYRFSRNPLYVGLTLLYLAIACGLGMLWPILLLPLVLVAMHWLVIVPEERYLEAKFGDEYRAYRARVRRWV